MKNKRGISPLLAAVLLLALTISMAAVVSNYVIKKTKPNAYDWLYVLKKTGEEYLVKKCFPGRRAITPQESHRLKSFK